RDNVSCSAPGSAHFTASCGLEPEVQRPICLPAVAVPPASDAGGSSSIEPGWLDAVREAPQSGSFTRIWGTNEHVWVVGSVLPSDSEDANQPESGPGLSCDSRPVRNAVFRRVDGEWTELEVPTSSELLA